MKANELRIGSWYDYNGKPKQVTPNTIEEVWIAEKTWCKPIPITEEWLLKFGFEKKEGCINNIYFILAGKILIQYDLVYNIVDFVKRVNFNVFISIKYVHQLQNLYFALTGEELIIKSEIV
jgi:hypothetical protein